MKQKVYKAILEGVCFRTDKDDEQAKREQKLFDNLRMDKPGLSVDQLRRICNLSQQSFSSINIQRKQLEAQISFLPKTSDQAMASSVVLNMRTAIGMHRDCIREIAKQTSEWDEIWTSMMEARHSCFILIMFSFGKNELATLYVRFCQRVFKAGLRQI